MRIIIAPDAYKGSVAAAAAAAAMGRGILAVFPDAQLRTVPVADGGEGTVAALVAATGGRRVRTRVPGPLGRPVQAEWGVLGDGVTAVLEMAAASGLPLLAGARDPRRASTLGTGALMRAAMDAGYRKLILGLGGSATNDGGAGLAQALGARFLDARERPLPPGGAALARLDHIDLAGLDPRLAGIELRVACDVANPLTGPEGASAVYGPQKGADPATVRELDRALGVLERVATQATGRDVARRPGAGAAGGLGAGLMWFTPAQLCPGVEIVLAAAGFEAMLDGADLVFTGEGRTDGQTAMGKAPAGVAAAARRHGVPVVCLSGGLDPDADLLLDLGVTALAAIVPGPMALADCLDRAEALIEAGAARACRLIRLGMGLR